MSLTVSFDSKQESPTSFCGLLFGNMSCGISFGRLLSGRMQNACAIAYAATLGDDDDAHSGPQKCTAPSLHQTTHPFPHPLPQLPKLILEMMSIGLATVTINIEVRGCRGLSSLVANWFVCPLSLLWFVYWFYGRGGSISSRTSLSIRRHVRSRAKYISE